MGISHQLHNGQINPEIFYRFYNGFHTSAGVSCSLINYEKKEEIKRNLNILMSIILASSVPNELKLLKMQFINTMKIYKRDVLDF